MNPDEIEQLKERVATLEDWKSKREQQQVIYPLDQRSDEILKSAAITPTGITVEPPGLINSPFFTFEAVVQGKKYWLAAGGKYRRI